MTALWTPAAGQEPTAPDVATLIPKYARRTSDATLSTTTLTADGVLLLPSLSTNVEYEVTTYILSRSAGSISLSCDFTFPTGAQIDNASFHAGGTGTFGITGANGAVSGITNTTTNRPTILRMILVMAGTAGTLQFRWACASASAVVVATGSYIVARQVT